MCAAGRNRVCLGRAARHKGAHRASVTVATSVELNAGKGEVVVTYVIAHELDVPPGVKLIEWRLLTNPSAANVAEVAELNDW